MINNQKSRNTPIAWNKGKLVGQLFLLDTTCQLLPNTAGHRTEYSHGRPPAPSRFPSVDHRQNRPLKQLPTGGPVIQHEC